MREPILIAAASLDEHAYAPVREMLEQRKYPAVVYKTDKVLSGEANFFLRVDAAGEVNVTYDGIPIGPDDISAAWCRKLSAFGLERATYDRAGQLYVTNEIRYTNDAVWSLYGDEVWLNSPRHMHKADKKLGQLVLAKQVGFSIPETVVGSNWRDIAETLLVDGDNIVVKMIRGVISEKDQIKSLPTTPLDRNQINALSEFTTPFPGLYQPFLSKSREWRITVVGDRVFAAAIYTDNTAKDDWRKLQGTQAVTFKKEAFAEEDAKRCSEYLRALGLKFGAFDFVETEDGELVFLECNSNGQYGWLESELGLDISGAITDELIAIAQSR